MLRATANILFNKYKLTRGLLHEAR